MSRMPSLNAFSPFLSANEKYTNMKINNIHNLTKIADLSKNAKVVDGHSKREQQAER